MREKLDSRALSALLSSLISQLIILLVLLFPSSSPLSVVTSSISSTTGGVIFPLLHHLLSSSDVASTLSLLSFSKKRKRAQTQSLDAPDDDDDGSRLARFPSVIPKNPDSFKSFFNMNSSTFEWLCGLLEPLLECRDPIDAPLNLRAESRLGIGLFRLATGADHEEISRRFRVSEPAAKFCVKQLCRVLCTNYRFWVGFPSQNELKSVSTQFETLTGLPNCCGILHCTRFKVKRNKGPDSILGDKSQEDSIAAQLVVDSSSRILNIAAGFRGDKDDFQVLKASTLYNDIKNGLLLNSGTILVNGISIPQYLVGGGCYPLLSWLVVPFDDPMTGSCEENFNNATNVLRLRMRRTIANLRGWGLLSRPIEAELKTAVAYVGACSILHNMLLTREDNSVYCPDLDEQSQCCQRFQGSRARDNGPSEEGIFVMEEASEIRSALASKATKSSNGS